MKRLARRFLPLSAVVVMVAAMIISDNTEFGSLSHVLSRYFGGLALGFVLGFNTHYLVQEENEPLTKDDAK